MFRIKWGWPVLSLVLLLAIAACSKDESPTGVEANDLTGYVTSLQYDADQLLNVQDTGNQDRKQTQLGDPEVTDEWVPGVGEKHCVRTRYNLQQNFDKLAIMRPTQGIVWPGALVKGNQSLTDGLPEPVTLARTPITLSIDLPGIGANGVKVVSNPTQSSVQAAIDEALEWWNANAYQDGYVNAASSAFNWSTSYSSEQTGLGLGLNMEWASGEVSSVFNTTTTTEKHVVTGAFQQAFYTITFDTPSSPGAVFDPAVTVDDARRQINADSPPAYIANVTYGRIIAVRMETTFNATTTDVEGAFKYSAGIQQASGTLETTYKQILSNSTFTVITLGGNAAVATELLTGPVASFEGMLGVIQGENAIYSRSNPGVPISYTVRYLANNALARLGSTTDYTATECTFNTAQVTVTYKGIKILGDCRLFEGYFYWTLGAELDGAFSTIARRTNAEALAGDDVVGTYHTINLAKTYSIPKTDGAEIYVVGDVWEKLTSTHFPHMRVKHAMASGWSTGTKSVTLDAGAVGISACKVRVDYEVRVE
jgi:thiol-activated cytolysin